MLKAISKDATSIPIIIVGTKVDKMLKMNDLSEDSVQEVEETSRREFAEHPETEPFWPGLKASFAFVSRGRSMLSSKSNDWQQNTLSANVFWNLR